MTNIVTLTKKSKEQAPFQVRSSSDSVGMKVYEGKFQNKLKNVCSSINSSCSDEQRIVLRNEEFVLQYVLSHSGCRISELLSLKQSDIIGNTDIFVHGKKGSASRILHFPELSQYFLMHKTKPSDPVFRIRYITFYRHCLSRGIFLKHRNSVNRSVTHSYRYKYIHALNDVARSEKEVADCIGHRSQKTSHQYLHKEI